ncbi:hypothetical protein CHRYSEOSP005_00230 [Chryseobacterium sp. Alg-005]|uniref:hypothetical protein n=1 Tax=Chryseobacterium sp. Alg-005 TaxID=3159516 RepID=UPI003555A2ED
MFSIKSKYKNKVVGFNGSATPLGERDDLDILAEIAVRSQDPTLLVLFSKVPTEEDIKKYKAKNFLKEEVPNND